MLGLSRSKNKKKFDINVIVWAVWALARGEVGNFAQNLEK